MIQLPRMTPQLPPLLHRGLSFQHMFPATCKPECSPTWCDASLLGIMQDMTWDCMTPPLPRVVCSVPVLPTLAVADLLASSRQRWVRLLEEQLSRWLSSSTPPDMVERLALWGVVCPGWWMTLQELGGAGTFLCLGSTGGRLIPILRCWKEN